MPSEKRKPSVGADRVTSAEFGIREVEHDRQYIVFAKSTFLRLLRL